MDFGTIASKVAQRISRPDLDDDIREAINDAIEFITVNGDFANDLVESSVAIDSTVYSQSLVISTTFTRFRKIKYLRPEGYNRYIKWQDASRIFDDNLQECKDVWYRAGDNIVFKLSNLASTMLYGYYQYPTRMSADTDTHWMLDQMYAVVFNYSMADMWDQVGNAEEGSRARQKADRFMLSHRRDHQDSVAHS